MAQEVLSFISPNYSTVLTSPTAAQARQALVGALCTTKALAFQFAPIDRAAIAKLAAQAGKPSASAGFAKVFPSIKLSQLEPALEKCVVVASPAAQDGQANKQAVEIVSAKKEKGRPSEFALSYFLNCLFENVFVAPKLAPSPSAKEVRLVANVTGWQAVRKVSIEKGKPKEVVACCATIFDSVRRKLPSYACAQGKTGEYEAFVEAFLSKFPLRKSFGRLGEILAAAASQEASVAAFAEKGFEKLLLELFYYRVLEQVGFPPFVSTDQVSRIYPDLKIPKPRGRIAGAKKK